MDTPVVLVLLCANILVSTEDIAVIIGGKWTGWKQPDQFHQSVEVYTKHLSENPTLCNSTNEEPHIPDLPMPIYAAAAVYLPDFGIYLCGGINDKQEHIVCCVH